ncbi:UNVERIFIED_CONTAM: hypothetical protein K2H54_000571 [Gekko kuhli]
MAPPGPRRAPGVLAVLLLAAVAGPAGAARVSSSLSTTHHVHHFHNKHGTVPIAINRTPFLTRGGHGRALLKAQARFEQTAEGAKLLQGTFLEHSDMLLQARDETVFVLFLAQPALPKRFCSVTKF